MAAMVAEEPARDDMGALGMLERLGNELSLRRGMHVSLAPDKADIPVLEVVSDLPGPVRIRRVSWRNGSFWMLFLQVPRNDIAQAADWIAADLGWTRSLGLVLPGPGT